jgi:septal ring factor EnvC (AmiA/AmiB activator)
LDPQRLVVRLHDPRRFRILVGVAAVLAVLLCFGLFELGQRAGGHSVLKGDERRQALRAEVGRLQAESQQLKEELAQVRTSLDVDREAQARLQDSLAASETRVAELNEELEFYRRIVVPPEGQSARLRVQTFEITPGSIANGYRLKLLLVQSPQRSGRAQGQVDLSLHGTLHGEERILTLQEVAAEPQAFEFLYFQDVDIDIILPEGFTPGTAEIELRSGQRNTRVVAASFPWKPRG